MGLYFVKSLISARIMKIRAKQAAIVENKADKKREEGPEGPLFTLFGSFLLYNCRMFSSYNHNSVGRVTRSSTGIILGPKFGPNIGSMGPSCCHFLHFGHFFLADLAPNMLRALYCALYCPQMCPNVPNIRVIGPHVRPNAPTGALRAHMCVRGPSCAPVRTYAQVCALRAHVCAHDAPRCACGPTHAHVRA